MEGIDSKELGSFAAIVTRGGKGPNPLREPSLRVIGGRTFIHGTFAWHKEYWLNGSTALLPFDEVTAIFSFPSEQEYTRGLERHQATEDKKNRVRKENESEDSADTSPN